MDVLIEFKVIFILGDTLADINLGGIVASVIVALLAKGSLFIGLWYILWNMVCLCV